jgi:hypothetical protein
MFDSSKESSQFERLRETVGSWLDRRESTVSLHEDHRSSRRVHNISSTQASGHHAGLFMVSIIGVVCGLGFVAYGLGGTTLPSRFIASLLPMPVALVNGTPVSLHDWQHQTTTLYSYYRREQVKDADITLPTVRNTKEYVLDRMIDQALIKDVAYRYNIQVTQAEINSQLEKVAVEAGGTDALLQQLKELYGWSIYDFSREIVEPLLLKAKVEIALQQDDRLNIASRKKAEQVMAMVRERPDQFAVLATQYSEDITALSGGDLGYFGIGDMVPEFDAAVASLEPGEVSDLVKTRFGYHIIQLEEKLYDDDGELGQFKARQILIRGIDVDDYLAQLKKEARIWVLVRL